MSAAVIVFPGSNCDRDAVSALSKHSTKRVHRVWHRDTDLPKVDLVILPGGFSYGDYLRSGAIAARSPIMTAVQSHAKRGGLLVGICNGFQILTETHLLPGALMRNAGLKFLCKSTPLRIENADTPFTRAYAGLDQTSIPIAHHDGNYFADEDTLDRLEGGGQIVFRYVNNPNGSSRDIAGITNKAGNVLGMMPHPERAIDPLTGETGGLAFFKSLAGVMA
ncbi:MAG: phosphoribosylformylglycinamidine synthase I [Robiginitomaculum sp.]|nr:MAG: phosphoribosylformylglycinamidine synthase I [Robiginitomaculum sp.]